MQRDGIVDFRPDLARRKEFSQLVAAVSADDVLMENVVRLREVCGRRMGALSSGCAPLKVRPAAAKN